MPKNQVVSEAPLHTNLTRRKACGVLGTSGLLLMASTAPSSAFFFSKPAPVDLSGLPSTWVRLQGRNLQDYANYLSRLKLKKVTPRQVILAHAKRRGSVWNSLPPKSMWKNMAPTLKVVDRVALELDRPVSEIISAYRSPSYNARCSGAKRGSWHKSNVALDVKFAIRPSTVSTVARNLRSKGYFKGGVGRYSSFTHIDTRGLNADW